MTNTLPFLPIHLQNLIFSYTRPVYPYIKELKEKEEERQKNKDELIKIFKASFLFKMRKFNDEYGNYENYCRKIKRDKLIHKIRYWGKNYINHYWAMETLDRIKDPINNMKYKKRFNRYKQIIFKYESLENRRDYDFRTYLSLLKEGINKFKLP